MIIIVVLAAGTLLAWTNWSALMKLRWKGALAWYLTGCMATFSYAMFKYYYYMPWPPDPGDPVWMGVIVSLFLACFSWLGFASMLVLPLL